MTKIVMVQWTAKKTVGIFLRILRGAVVTRMEMLADVCMGYMRLPASGGDLIDIVPVRRYFLGVTSTFHFGNESLRQNYTLCSILLKLQKQLT
jgi:hypothetical protein